MNIDFNTLNNIFIALPSAIIIFNKEFIIQHCNDAFLKLSGLTRDKVIRHHIFQVLYMDQKAIKAFNKAVDDIINNKESETMELESSRKVIGYNLFRITIKDENYFGMIMKNITDQKELQWEMLLSEKLSGLDALASGMAHEINNPLYGIVGMAEAILDFDDMEMVKEYASDIINLGEKIAEIVKDLSKFAHLQRKRKVQTVDMNRNINYALKFISHVEFFESVEVVTKYKENMSPVLIKPSDLLQIVLNLINRSISALMKKKEDGRRILIETSQEGDNAILIVEDNGVEIQKEQKELIFHPFFIPTRELWKKIGLGLYVVYRLVRDYNGKINFESSAENGTKFIISLPIISKNDDLA